MEEFSCFKVMSSSLIVVEGNCQGTKEEPQAHATEPPQDVRPGYPACAGFTRTYPHVTPSLARARTLCQLCAIP